MEIRKGLIAVGAVLLALSCGGKQSMASKSAAAYREAAAKGVPVGSGDHGGHTAQTSSTSMAGMDHSQMQHGSSQSITNMPGMKPDSMSGMDHSKMRHGSAKTTANMPGMQHGSMDVVRNMPGMQHGSSHSMANMPGMKPGSMSGMDHSKMQHGSAKTMANMPGMHHSAIAVAPVAPAPTNSSGIARLNPAATLNTDEFDQPSPVAVSEANKAKPPGDTEE